MRQIVTIAFLLPAVVLVGAQPAPPTAREIGALVAQLGSDDYQERETATKKLEEIGEPAMEQLRVGCRSDNPEVVRRSQEVLRKIERRLANEKILTPTLVSLNAKERPLDEILADLSKQAKCEVVLNGMKVEQLAAQKFTVSTEGEVPFWAAVLKVCDKADLQIGSVGGYLAPDAMPYRSAAQYPVDMAIHIAPETSLKFRVAKNPQQAVILQPRNARRRPAAVQGAVLVEVCPFPMGSEPPEQSVLLQAWSEPRLQWQWASSVRVTTAVTKDGTKLVSLPGLVAQPQAPTGRSEKMVLLRNADGSATFAREAGSQVARPFAPNVRQAVVRFKTGEKSLEEIRELHLSLFATVRSAFEPLSQASGLQVNRPATGIGLPGVELTAVYNKAENGRLVATVTVSYDPLTVSPAGMSDELLGAKVGAGPGNQTVYGVRVTDATGKPYTLGLASGRHELDAGRARVTVQATLELHALRDGLGPPAAITFWGTHAQQIEVPVSLKDVPVSDRE